MTKKELLNKIEKQQEIIDALFSHLKLEYKPEEYIQKSFIGESKIKTRIVVSERKNVFIREGFDVAITTISKYKPNGRKTKNITSK